MPDFSAMDRIVLQDLQDSNAPTVYYTPVGGTRGELSDVLFFDPDTPIQAGDVIFEGSGPQFAVHAEDCPNLAQKDVFERDGVTYACDRVGKDEGYLWIAYCRVS